MYALKQEILAWGSGTAAWKFSPATRPTALCQRSPVEYDVCGALKKVHGWQGLL